MRARPLRERRSVRVRLQRIALPAVLLLLLPLAVGAAPDAGPPAPAAAAPAQQQEAAIFLARARQLLVQGHYGPALAAVRKAAQLDPKNATIRRLLSQARAAAGLGGPDVIQPIKEQYAAKNRSVIRQAEHSLFDAQKALAGKDYTSAAQHARRALAAIRYVDNAERSAELRTRGEKILAAAEAALKRRLHRQRQRDFEQARADGQERLRRARSVRDPALRALRQKARKLHLDGEYDAALAAAREALKIGPEDEEARAIEQKALEASEGPRGLGGRSRRRARREDDLMAALDRELTPHPKGQIVLPGKAKDRAGPAIRRKPMAKWERELRAKLAEEVAIDFKATPLEDCVEQLAAIGKVNIVLDPDAARETPITIGHTRMPLEALLRWVARFANLHYCLRDGAVLLTTGSGALDEPVRRVYDISSLVVPEDDSVPTAIIDATMGMPGPVEPLPRRTAKPKPVEVDTDGLGQGWASFLCDTVAPGTWDLRADTLQEAGPRYTIQYRNGRIVVVHTPEVHKQIEELLNNFRRARNLQVHILGRFLQIEQTFLERLTLAELAFIGPDANGPGEDPDGGKRYAFTPVTLTNDTDIIREVADPLDPTAPPLLQPLARFTDVLPTGGLAFSWSYIGVKGHQASALINAVLKRQKGTLLQAPRLTCFNTQRANIQVLVNRNYVRRISSDEEPEIGNVPEGIIFDVQPFVSADRRYITVVLQPQQRELIAMTSFSFSTGLEDTDDIFGAVALVGRTVQVPTTRLRSLGTTVTIPNGGTLIVGGFSEVEERAGVAGIPFIEAIPLLNKVLRGFDNAEGRRSLLLLITAEIVRDVFSDEE